ncbi:MAG: 3'-5' exonuclease [Muribaculaceae bacterium]|nr:3'-5' exonuclease [Muribaculaceae bacterium]MBR6640390.1 3'-5' exonuclease [Muribaculaceae bacterium]
MELNLKKPIIFFDLETTGTNITQDRIVEISMIKIMPNGEEIERTLRINPEIPIPAEATAVHGITDADVANCRTFKMIAKDLAQSFTGCDIAGFNSNRFDIPMLDQEFQRAGVKYDFTKPNFIDVQTIFHKKEQRTLVAAYKFYCGKDLTDAHSASADTRATYEVLKAQLDRYEDLPNDIVALSEFSSQNRNVDLAGRVIYNENKQEVINFGKYKGKLVIDVLKQDPGYYSWIIQGDFPQNTKDVFTNIKLRGK